MAHIGRKLTVGLGRETTYGTISASILGMGTQSLEVDRTKEILLNDQSYGRIEDVKSSRRGNEMSQVTITGIAEMNTFGHLLYGALGTLTTSDDDPESGANTHTFTVLNTNAHPSYSILYKDDVQDKVVLGARLMSLSLTVTAGDWVTYTAVYLGKKAEDNTSSISYTASAQLSSEDAMARMSDVGVAFSGTGLCLSTMSLSIEKNAEAHFCIGSTSPSKIINKQLAITGSITRLFESNDYQSNYEDHDIKAIEASFSTGTIPTTATPYSTKITLPKLHFSNWTVSAGNDDKVEETVDFKAEFYDTDSAMITADLINDNDNSDY